MRTRPAWLPVLFLVPVTLSMHAFWAVPDPMMRMMQQGMFMKNLGLLDGWSRREADRAKARQARGFRVLGDFHFGEERRAAKASRLGALLETQVFESGVGQEALTGPG